MDDETETLAPAAVSVEKKPRLLIVEDDSELRAQMKWALARDYDVEKPDRHRAVS